MAEAIVLDVIERDLTDEPREDRDPVQRHLLGAPATGGAREATDRAAPEQKPALPRVSSERDDVRAQHLSEFSWLGGAKAARDADVLQRPLVVVEAEQQRAE